MGPNDAGFGMESPVETEADLRATIARLERERDEAKGHSKIWGTALKVRLAKLPFADSLPLTKPHTAAIIAINRLESRLAAAEAVVVYTKRMAEQRLPSEVDEDERGNADYEGAWDCAVREARAAQAAVGAAVNGGGCLRCGGFVAAGKGVVCDACLDGDGGPAL